MIGNEKHIDELTKVIKFLESFEPSRRDQNIKNKKRFIIELQKLLGSIKLNYVIKKETETIISELIDELKEAKTKLIEYKELINSLDPVKDSEDEPGKIKKLYKIYLYLRKKFSGYMRNEFEVLFARLAIATAEKDESIQDAICKEIYQNYPEHIQKNEMGLGTIEIGEKKIEINLNTLREKMTYKEERIHVKRGEGIDETPSTSKEEMARRREEERRSDPMV